MNAKYGGGPIPGRRPMNGLTAHRSRDILMKLVLVVAALYFGREFFVPLAGALDPAHFRAGTDRLEV